MKDLKDVLIILLVLSNIATWFMLFSGLNLTERLQDENTAYNIALINEIAKQHGLSYNDVVTSVLNTKDEVKDRMYNKE